ncbi:MAG: polyribonucleotide nucleotidyltransferase [Patescibacteria group bacterium]|nr:polyribonucleotide nucleotidyltransferase [Patescibacteria group bacterium]
MEKKFEAQVGGRSFTFSTGKLATLASGSVVGRLGDTVVLATAVVSPNAKAGAEFFPLMVEFEEKMYASGKISGSRFIKREGRPSEEAILTARLIDRPIRPLFPKGFYNDVQIVITTLSADLSNDPDIVALNTASAALMQTGSPFQGPVAGIRVGRIDGELVANPTREQRNASDLDLVIAGTKDAVMMVEAGANEVPEDVMLAAIDFGHKAMQPLIEFQEQMVKELNIQPGDYQLIAPSEELKHQIASKLSGRLEEAIYHSEKMVRNAKLDELRQELFAEFVAEETPEVMVESIFDKVIGQELRKNIIEHDRRPDGRGLDDIRPLSMEVGLLPSTHGSALFTRGETQALSVVTLGSLDDEQLIDTMEQDTTKRYMHHYNFPPFATNEAKPMRSTGRREIGHGALAERALSPMIPNRTDFPYTIRVVSEILSSNGSSSMASVCGSTLSLMDTGVPIKKPVAGVAMGLITNGDQFKVLTDLAGIEDFNGDMDFKVAGSRDGITALQMDIKIAGITRPIFEQALAKAKQARMFLLDEMAKIIAAPRPEVSPRAPRVITVQIPVDKIGEIIGPGGKVINGIIDEAGGKSVTTISIEDDGQAFITSTKKEMAEQAAQTIRDMVREIKPGEKFTGRVTRVMDFGAFVEILPGREGMVHISQFRNERVENINDVVKEGDTLEVIVTEIDDRGRINLSHKAVLNKRQ